MIDWTRLAALAEDIGPDDLAMVVDVFLDEAAEAVERLRAGVTEDDLHFLKGAALNLGLAALADLCAAQEAALRAGDPMADPDRIATLFAQSRDALRSGIPPATRHS